MSAYPPPPGSKPTTSTPTPSSLPARPPPPAGGPPRPFKPAFPPAISQAPSHYASAGSSSYASFAPRAVTASQPYKVASSVVSAGPQPPSTYGAQPSYNTGFQQSGYQQGYYGPGYQDGFAGPTPPQIRNPFAAPTLGASIGPAVGGYGAQQNVDPDMEAQIAQWQSAYANNDDTKNAKGGGAAGFAAATGANTGPVGNRQETETKPGTDAKPKTVQRAGGGQTWNDSSLLEWDPAHFRLFVGNLAGEVTDDSLLKAFVKYPSVQRARVIRDKRTTKSKGYGFISFSDGDDYFKAARDMQGKYIGSHPVLIKKSTTEIKAVNQKDPRHQHRKGGKGGGGGNIASNGNGALGAHTGAGISKKAAKTKGGLKILG